MFRHILCLIHTTYYCGGSDTIFFILAFYLFLLCAIGTQQKPKEKLEKKGENQELPECPTSLLYRNTCPVPWISPEKTLLQVSRMQIV